MVDFVESVGLQPPAQRVRVEERPAGLSALSADPTAEVVKIPVEAVKRLPRNVEGEDDAAQGRQRADVAQRRLHRAAAQVDGHSQPREERRDFGVEGSGLQRRSHSVFLQVHRPVFDVVGDRDAAAAQQFVLEFLRLGLVHFDDAQPPRPLGLAVGEGVEAGAQEYVLFHASRRRLPDLLLHVAAAVGDETTGRPEHGVFEQEVIPLDLLFGRALDEAHRERVVEDLRRMVEDLMRSAQHRGDHGRRSCLDDSHGTMMDTSVRVFVTEERTALP